MWLAENWGLVLQQADATEMTHPRWIRQAYNEPLKQDTPNIVVERGKRAYQKIKADAATMRENWRAVGEALLVGRKLHPSNQAFGKWCVEEGFDMDPSVRSNAMWLAENWPVLQSLQDDTLVHPTGIRQAYNESLSKSLLEGTEVDSLTTTPTIELDTRSAEKVVKLVRRAEAGDEGIIFGENLSAPLDYRHSAIPPLPPPRPIP